MSEWQKVGLSHCADLIRDSADPQVVQDQPYVGLEHIPENTLALASHGYSRDVSSTKFIFQKGDILFGKLRPYFRKLIIAPFSGMCSTDIWVIRSKKGVCQRYIFYVMSTQAFIDFATTGSNGTHMPRADWDFVQRYEIPLPPLPVQRRIVHILGTLDDKIEHNRRVNATLEAIARALFTSWFVDFDPVRAKADGRTPTGMSAELAALFPATFEDSPLGKIPSGWRVVHLSDCLEAARGLSYKGSGLSKEGMPLHNLDSVLKGGGYKYNGIKYYTGDYKPRHIVKPGELIVTNAEQRSDFLLIGCPAIVPQRYGEEGLFSNHIFRVRPWVGSPIGIHFAYQLLLSPQVRQQITGYANGTTVNMLPIDGLRHPIFVMPSAELARRYEQIAQSLYERTEHKEQESCTLAALRDALLPRLLSGDGGGWGSRIS